MNKNGESLKNLWAPKKIKINNTFFPVRYNTNARCICVCLQKLNIECLSDYTTKHLYKKLEQIQNTIQNNDNWKTAWMNLLLITYSAAGEAAKKRTTTNKDKKHYWNCSQETEHITATPRPGTTNCKGKKEANNSQTQNNKINQ